MKVVVFFSDGDCPLCVSDFGGDASNFTGFVENGLWNASFNDGVLRSKDHNGRERSRSICTVTRIVEVPDSMAGCDYNEVIVRAAAAIAAEETGNG